MKLDEYVKVNKADWDIRVLRYVPKCQKWDASLKTKSTFMVIMELRSRYGRCSV